MPFSVCLIIAVVGGLIISVLIKLLFNKITGKNASDFSSLSDFLGAFITCSVIILIILISINMEMLCAIGH